MTDFNIVNKRILITGASGFIGRNLTKRLSGEGALVRALVRNPAKAEAVAFENVEIIFGDITDPVCVDKAVSGCSAVIHLAAVLGDDFKPREIFRSVNVEGTRSLALSAVKHGVERFMHCGTVWVYGPDSNNMVNEQCPLLKKGIPYCDTKIEGEIVIREMMKSGKLPGIIFEPTDVYGPGDETYTLEPLRLMKSGQMILPGSGRGLINPLFIGDLIDGILLALTKGRIGEAYILGTPETVTCRKFFKTLAQSAGYTKKLPSIPAWLALTTASLFEFYSTLTGSKPLFTKEAIYATLIRDTYDGSKAWKELGFNPKTTLAEGMKLSVGTAH